MTMERVREAHRINTPIVAIINTCENERDDKCWTMCEVNTVCEQLRQPDWQKEHAGKFIELSIGGESVLLEPLGARRLS